MFSDGFLALPVDEQNKKIVSAGNSDPSILPQKIQNLIKQSVDTLLVENEPFGRPTLNDKRASEQAA